MLIDDIITDGASKFEAIEPLEEAGLVVKDLVILIDREQGGRELLAAKGYTLHSVLTISQCFDEWERARASVDAALLRQSREFLRATPVRVMRPAARRHLGEVLVDQATVQAEVARLAAQISADYADKRLHLVGVLKGSTVFLADLMRALTIPATRRLHLDRALRGQVTTSGVVRIRKDLDEPIEGRDVLLVEGICASGLTLSYLLRNFQTRNPASIKVCAFVAKQREGPAFLVPDYVGREIPDVFVVGYGLDREEQYRNLPHIARLA